MGKVKGMAGVKLARKIKIVPTGGKKRGTEEEDAEGSVKHAAGLTFKWTNGSYIDTRYDKNKKTKPVPIEALGEDYLELLASYPQLKEVFALGEHIIINFTRSLSYQKEEDLKLSTF